MLTAKLRASATAATTDTATTTATATTAAATTNSTFSIQHSNSSMYIFLNEIS